MLCILRIMKNATKRILLFIIIQFTKCAEKDMEAFVVGGDFVNISKYPHSAFLDARCKSEGHWICGSSILNQRVILTAAHCVVGCQWSDKDSQLVAYIGNSNLKKVSIKRKVIDVRVHSDFNDKTMDNDIALAVTRRNIPFGPNVKRVVISMRFPESILSSDGYVAGWGLISDDHQISSIRLKHLTQKVRSRKTCTLIGDLNDGMFCAGSSDKSADHPAQGDSGSALVTASGYHQVGLVSFCLKRYPSLMVYTNVSYYFEWIENNSKILYCDNNDK